MRSRAPVLLACACGGSDGEPTQEQECLEPQLELWCFHSEADGGPVVPDTGQATCETPSDAGARPCDPYVVVFSGIGETGINHYFLDGVHAATQYWGEVAYECGASVYWYGEVVEDCR